MDLETALKIANKVFSYTNVKWKFVELEEKFKWNGFDFIGTMYNKKYTLQIENENNEGEFMYTLFDNNLFEVEKGEINLNKLAL